ncbi:MAG: hypothetical protein LBD28_05525, partial [Tannerellaceae bacterium]|nr:hypothetical protein [Tannerellaceae bacterium]
CKCWKEKTFDFSVQQLILEKKQVCFPPSKIFGGKNICDRHPADFRRKKRISLGFGIFLGEN